MVIEHLPDTRASRRRRPHNPWPMIVSIMIVVGVVGATLLAQH
jgi:hypothetical protein